MRLAVVVEASRNLEQWDRDLCFWSEALRHRGGDEGEQGGAKASVLTLPASESDPYAGASPHAETLERRALTLWRLAQGQGSFVLLTARALARRTVKPEQLRSTGATLRRDEDHAPEELIELLLASGYMREDPIGAVGEFSLRGGILDVWSPGHERPVRVEFFGDTVDSIREFDPETQLSVAQLQRIEIVPMREYALGADDFRLWAELARERWTDERYERALRDRTVYADEGETFAGWEWLVSLTRL
jgi:transcription-repair coupling factor (superfamily II helicase)